MFKSSIMLHSFSQPFMRGRMTLEEVVKKAAEFDAEYVEVVAEQMVERYPAPSEEWMDSFQRLIADSGLKPSCYSVYIDSGRWKGRFLNEAERFTLTLNAMEYAKKMGFPVVRSQDALLPTTMEKLLPYAEALKVHLAIELHGPWVPTTPIFEEYYALFEKAQSEYIGVVPDFSSFTSGAPGSVMNRWDGVAHREVLDEINGLYSTTEIPESELEQKIVDDGGDDIDVRLARAVIFNQHRPGMKMGTPFFRTKPDFEGFRRLVKYSKNMHGKFLYVDENLRSLGLDYPKLIGILREEGYEGFLASEFEGEFVDPNLDAVEQISRHLRMVKQLWNEAG